MDHERIDDILTLYCDEKLSTFNMNLINNFFESNCNAGDFNEYDINIKYKDYCSCKKNIDEDCPCVDNIGYVDDEFMHDKIPFFPKNYFVQQYIDKIFPKRNYKTKIFYYIPKNTKIYFSQYINNEKDAVNIYRNISYYFINNELILIKDTLYGWFGKIFEHQHTKLSKSYNGYKLLFENSVFTNENIQVIK